jgi:PBSX family phage portal protein
MAESLMKAYVVGKPVKPGQSQQLPESLWAEAYAVGEVVEPPYDLWALAQLYETNATHKACVDAKTTNTVGLGYHFVPVGAASAEAAAGANRDNLALLENLFGNCNPEQTFTEIMRMVWTDVECLGNGYLEITRNSRGMIDGFYHVPATSVRLRTDGSGFEQIRFEDKRYFRHLGAREATDPISHEPENEIMHLKKYTPQSSFYGIPDIVAALPAVLGDKEAREYNIDFFSNHAVPRMAIIVEGGQLSDDVLAQIQEYMETEIKGQGHKTLVLDVPGNDVHIRLEPLTVGTHEDAAFLEYRKANRDEVMMVHRVPPSKVTVVENANLSNSTDQDKTFREQVVQPEQQRVEHRFNRMIREQMGIGDWEFRFAEMDLSQALQEAQIAQIYSKIGVWSAEEIRAKQMAGNG